MGNSSDSKYILGIDLGSNSLGWAVLAMDQNGGFTDGIQTGVRSFEAGMEGDIESGKEASRSISRREARLQRRQNWRRAYRLKKLFSLLQEAKLLPTSGTQTSQDRHRLLNELDKQIYQRHIEEISEEERYRASHLLPYLLRKKALSDKLEFYELGRALYHLAQRRGFLSNRRSTRKKEEGEVKKGIGRLQEQMNQANARTLGEYFLTLDPAEERIRNRYTSRKMYEDEFEKIWAEQAKHYPDVLTEELKRRVWYAIFYQRPLKSQKHLIKNCELEPRRKSAPVASLLYQRFRLLQQVNNARLITSDGKERKLTREERQNLINALETEEEVAFEKALKIIGVSSGGCSFKAGRGGEKRFVGNKTAARLREIFGERWDSFSEEEKNRIVDDVRSFRKEEALKRRGINYWKLDEESAQKFGELSLEERYCSFSRRALEKLIPYLEQGLSVEEAIQRAYPNRPVPSPVDELPPLNKVIQHITNPAVSRALTELRRVVNAITKKYGKPETIRIELARDLKKGRKEREAISKKNRQNEKRRKDAAEKIASEAGIQDPSRDDIEKYLLAEECGFACPYCGARFSLSSLFGDLPAVDVEHIIPFHRSFDNSFMNKTVSCRKCNSEKSNRTPFEAFSSNAQRWEEILRRVKNFEPEKLKKFKLESLESLDDFISRQLNDTRYASKLATKYLGLLYGCRPDQPGVDQNGKRRVQATRGQVTAILRNAWNLNSILGGSQKLRDDYRQHAIDAVVIALTTPGVIKSLSDASRSSFRRHAPRISYPSQDFLDNVRKSIESIVVSHRVSKKVQGPLHEETFYGRNKDENGNTYFCVRKPLRKLTDKEVDQIIDPKVKECVKRKLEELNLNDPEKAFSDRANHPHLRTKDGRKIPIHCVRIKARVQEELFPLARGTPYERWVTSKENHHIEIYETKDRKGRTIWDGEVVSRFEAMRRLRKGEPIVKRDHGPDKKFIFSLAKGEIIYLKGDKPYMGEGLYRVTTVPQSKQIVFKHINDARPDKNIPTLKRGRTARLDTLREMECQKVVVTPLGEVRNAND
ncbi:MAG: type II CRISPR RNA-guided endonuclease Cas9 [Planctomycetota bacterium]|nr:type II CRISPR RNA-guided endonuclease Cas9 [Planctomycetota bacterium]